MNLSERYLAALNAISAVHSNEDDLDQVLEFVQRLQSKLDDIEDDIIHEMDVLEGIL